MNDYKLADIKCPFYKSTKEPKDLKCEGIISKSCTHHFRSLNEKVKTEKEFCEDKYYACVFFKILNSKY